jgi:hypothetical protein
MARMSKHFVMCSLAIFTFFDNCALCWPIYWLGYLYSWCLVFYVFWILNHCQMNSLQVFFHSFW